MQSNTNSRKSSLNCAVGKTNKDIQSNKMFTVWWAIKSTVISFEGTGRS